jgi:hypothetical protein
MHYAFDHCHADFFFAKALHLDQESMRKSGISGWAVKNQGQCENKKIDNFISGKSRPSGSAVAFRTKTLQKYRYDQDLGPLSDFYLNNLMILKHKSYYYGKIVSQTLERKSSYSNTFTRTQSLALAQKTVNKFESDGIFLTDDQKRQYLEYESNQWPH